jgi:hypothetical protein
MTIKVQKNGGQKRNFGVIRWSGLALIFLACSSLAVAAEAYAVIIKIEGKMSAYVATSSSDTGSLITDFPRELSKEVFLRLEGVGSARVTFPRGSWIYASALASTQVSELNKNIPSTRLASSPLHPAFKNFMLGGVKRSALAGGLVYPKPENTSRAEALWLVFPKDWPEANTTELLLKNADGVALAQAKQTIEAGKVSSAPEEWATVLTQNAGTTVNLRASSGARELTVSILLLNTQEARAVDAALSAAQDEGDVVVRHILRAYALDKAGLALECLQEMQAAQRADVERAMSRLPALVQDYAQSHGLMLLLTP